MWGFFYVARMDEVFTHTTPGSPHMPRRCTPAPPARPDGLHTTDSSADRARCKADHTPVHTPGRWTRCTGMHSIPDRTAASRSGRRRGWSVCNPSIMCVVIVLSQAWYIDSRLYKYHTNILLHLVIANCYLSIDIQSY